MIQCWFEHKGQRMTDDDLDAELNADHKLDDAMKGEIRRRHGHLNQKYIYRNTAEGLVDGSITPRVPAPSSSKIPRREAAGLTNLPHFDSRMVPLFERAVHTPLPSSSSRSMRDHLESPNRQYYVHTPTHIHPPKLVKGHSQTVMGHGPEDAVDYFNREGHKHPKSYNKAHNSSASVYHGLEDKHASASSGGSTVSRYLSPSPTHGSHPSYYRRDHPQFDRRNPWHSYANQQDAQNRIRYVSPAPVTSSSSSAPSSLPPPTLAIPTPVSSQPTSSSLSQPTTLPAPSFSNSSQPAPPIPQPPSLLPSLSALFSSAPSSQDTLPKPSLPPSSLLMPPRTLPSFSSLSASLHQAPSSSSSSTQPHMATPLPRFTSQIVPQAPLLVRPVPLRIQQAPPEPSHKHERSEPTVSIKTQEEVEAWNMSNPHDPKRRRKDK